MTEVIKGVVDSHSVLDGFIIERGFDEELAAKLVEASKQPRIREMAPRDMTERFPSPEKAMDWFEAVPERVVYQLGYRAHLAGVAWFTPTPRYGARYTFAIRAYEPFAGNGVGTTFAGAAHEALGREYWGALWADVLEGNIASLRMAAKTGYQRVEHGSEAEPGRVHLLRPPVS